MWFPFEEIISPRESSRFDEGERQAGINGGKTEVLAREMTKWHCHSLCLRLVSRAAKRGFARLRHTTPTPDGKPDKSRVGKV